MRLISWNVNGIRAAVKKGFLDYLAVEEPDILCIQESKAHKEQLTSEILKDHGYYTFLQNHLRKNHCHKSVLDIQINLFLPCPYI